MPDELTTAYRQLIELFITGVKLGIAGVALKWIWARLVSRWQISAGFAIVIAYLIGHSLLNRTDDSAWIAFLFLFFASAIRQQSGKNVLYVLMLLSGSILFFRTFPHQNFLLLAFMACSILCFVSAISYMDTHLDGSRLLFFILPVSAAAIFTSVPDTEGAVLLLGITTGTLLFLIAPGRPLFGSVAIPPFAGMLMWMIYEGGRGRPASIIVSIGCLGLLIAEPVAHAISNRFLKPGFVYSKFTRFVLHCLSPTISIGYARVTEDMGRAALVATIAILIPVILLLVPRGLKSGAGASPAAWKCCFL